ncbi:aminotransferase class III-fold pyridoxal phosphate-dependent enzyme [bacterium]|nr:aminotransferase class III-fold pyridoxal phosphate-dependent enzyme [bacterium]
MITPPTPPAYPWTHPDARDLDLWERQLKDFVPPDAFDAHAHLWSLALFPEPKPPLLADSPAVAGRAEWATRVGSSMPGKAPTGALFLPYPVRGVDVAATNEFLAAEVRNDPGSRALMLITPRDDPAAVETELASRRFAGFKVYHCFAATDPTTRAPAAEYLPEWTWEIAHRRGLAITLHLVQPRALAEPTNQQYVRQHCERYPGAKLILAHAGRGFSGRHTAEGIGALRGLDNVFFDTSGVCEAAAFTAILRTFGPTRLMFGTDFPVSELRTRAVNLGDGFAWLNELNADLSLSRWGAATLLGLESLLALREACANVHFTDSDVEQIFCRTGRQVLSLPLPRPLPDVQAAYREAKHIIPGGTQLLSKRPEMFAPDQWPAYFREARGCEVIDLSGRRYIDMSINGILSCLLGFADPDVNAAVIRRVELGSMRTQQTVDEVDLAKLLLEIHPWAGMARFARSGGESMAVAVRIVRARTGRDKIALCGYHGWHDWYLATNLAGADRLTGHLLPGLEPKGVPAGLAGTVLPFRYGNLEELDAILAAHGPDLAAVVMEPMRFQEPEPGFLEGVRARCDKIGARLVFDEITVGWRFCLGGAHRRLGVTPDVAVFAKAISNGYAMGAIIGTRDTMAAAQESFISSTYWTEGIGPAAALACVRKHQRLDVPAHLAKIGGLVMAGWRRLGETHRLPIKVLGRPEMALLSFDHPENDALLTLMTARMLKRGFLAGAAFDATLAHEPRHVTAYLAALDEVFAALAAALSAGDVRARIGGPVKHTGFARLT